MKKILPIVLILLLLGVGGYFYFTSRGMLPNLPMGTGTNSGGSVFTSIKDALSKSISLKCIYTNDEGVETTTYIKGGAVRIMMAANTEDSEQPDNILMKDKKMYMWNDSTKKGFVYSIEEPKDISPFPTVEDSQATEDTSGAGQEESVLESIEKFKDACKAETIADSMFVVPTDVDFQDMSAFQEQMMKTLPTMPQGATGDDDATMPDGSTSSSSDDYQKYLEEMMKQQQDQ